MTLTKNHIRQTESLIRENSESDESLKEITDWLLKQGYYPEPYVVPPCFTISNFKLLEEKIETKAYDDKWQTKHLAEISFPKTGLVQRTFGIMHPKIYHDIVWELMDSWDDILTHIFNHENQIYSYSFPVSIPKDDGSKLRSGRMIYEFLEMAEKDLTAEAHNFKYLAKVDITNFYNSVYTHTISWAWIGDRIEALKDSGLYEKLGTRLDKLFQYANDKRTNGIPVGPVLSDLVVEIILVERDIVISKKVEELKIQFLATRFKDDYRFLCHSEQDCRSIIKIVIEVLNEFNLQVNEKKTNIELLPDGLYRKHSLLYEPYSLRHKYDRIPFKVFESTYLKTLQIHREHLGTSIIEKFLGELIDNDRDKELHQRLKVDFANEKIPSSSPNYLKVKKQNIKKGISLLLLLKNESTKTMGKVLAIIECMLLDPENKWLIEDNYLVEILLSQYENAIVNSSAFELIWLIYFTERHSCNIDVSRLIKTLKSKGKIDKTESELEVLKNPFVATIRNKMPAVGKWPNPFGDKDIEINMYIPPKELTDIYLIDYLDVFRRVTSE
jgi:hypothetical protein